MYIAISIIVVSLLVPILMCAIISPTITNSNEYRYPLKFLIFGISGFLLVLLLNIWWLHNNSQTDLVNIILLVIFDIPMFGGSIYFILSGVNWKIELRQGELIFRNFFRITRKYNYSEINKIEIYPPHRLTGSLPEKYVIYICKRHIKMECTVTNFEDFIKEIKKNMRENNSFCNIVKVSRKEK